MFIPEKDPDRTFASQMSDAPKRRWCGRAGTIAIVVLLGLLVGGVFVIDAWRESGEILSGLTKGAGWSAFVIGSSVAAMKGTSNRRCEGWCLARLFRRGRRAG